MLETTVEALKTLANRMTNQEMIEKGQVRQAGEKDTHYYMQPSVRT